MSCGKPDLFGSSFWAVRMEREKSVSKIDERTAVNIMTEEALSLARVIWDYHWVRQTAIPGDLIIAMGTNDLRVAEYASDLYHRGYGSTLVCSGGIAHVGDLLATG